MEREQFKVLVKAMKAVYAQPTFIPDEDAQCMVRIVGRSAI